ncbi:MAG: M1 family metallopeptidase [Acidobacteriota bacterium]|nr:M1 family metallopeptidase [Acidobacteriota bacterium]
MVAPVSAVEPQGVSLNDTSGISGALSPRNANYSIDVRLDPEARFLEGRQVVQWRNIQQQPTAELRFHVYWNAWRNNESTWMREDRFRGRSDRGEDILEGDWSYVEVETIRLLAAGERPDADLARSLRFVAPDDGNTGDRSVFQVDLPEPVEPGESIEVELSWVAKIPRTFARTGFRGDFFFIAHWFPKLGVFEDGGWTAPQYHSATEYYSDFGVYDVRISVPTGWTLGATGRKVEKTDNNDGSTTHHHIQEDVHGFAWTTSPDYIEFLDRFEAPGLPGVDIRLLMQPEHRKQKDRHLAATRAALELYGSWYGPYPYGHITVIDPAYGSGAGGMEYPTLFTCGTRWINPFGAGSPEGVTIHEAGHQFWYGIVGNDEFNHAWIDEGLNSFSDARVYDEKFGDTMYRKLYFVPPGTEQRGFFPRLFHGFSQSRATYGNGLDRYRPTATSDAPAKPTFRYHPATASGISYSKTALWLHTLERLLGWSKLQPAMAAFFERHKFAHPRPADLESVVSEYAGQDLGWFFDQVVGDSSHFDYAIDSADSFRIEPEGYFEVAGKPSYRAKPETEDSDADEGSMDSEYRSEVVVRRLGTGVFPVDVLMVFEDGAEIRRRWDGADRWKLFVEEKTSKLVSVTVDPERVLLLDLDYTNNSRVLDSKPWKPALKWASRWMLWFQDLMGAFAYYV